jgi:outer membrane biosynthesis protein TonB
MVVIPKGEVYMKRQYLEHEILLPPVGAPDVAKRVVHISTFKTDGSSTSQEIDVAVPNLTFTKLFEPNEQVTLILNDVDAAGNVSDPSNAVVFVATDKFAPPAPGEVGIRAVREVWVDEPDPTPTVPDPVPEPEPAPEEIIVDEDAAVVDVVDTAPEPEPDPAPEPAPEPPAPEPVPEPAPDPVTPEPEPAPEPMPDFPAEG